MPGPASLQTLLRALRAQSSAALIKQPLGVPCQPCHRLAPLGGGVAGPWGRLGTSQRTRGQYYEMLNKTRGAGRRALVVDVVTAGGEQSPGG